MLFLEILHSQTHTSITFSAWLYYVRCGGRLWENDALVLRQLDGVGVALCRALAKDHIFTFQELASASTQAVATATNRTIVWAAEVKHALRHIPSLELSCRWVRGVCICIYGQLSCDRQPLQLMMMARFTTQATQTTVEVTLRQHGADFEVVRVRPCYVVVIASNPREDAVVFKKRVRLVAGENSYTFCFLGQGQSAIEVLPQWPSHAYPP
jgi:hypothetical protein